MNPSSVPDALAPNAEISARPTTMRDYLGVSLFWLALSFFWGALLTIALPSRVETLFGENGKVAALSILSASGAAVAGVSQIMFGALSDGSRSKWGRRRPFLLVGTLLSVWPLLLFPFARTLAALLLVYCALQLFINVAGGPYGALMHDVIPPEKHNAASAWIGVSGLLGRIGGPFIAAVLLGSGIKSKKDPGFSAALNAVQGEANFHTLMLIFIGVLVVVMLATLWLAHEKPGQAPHSPLAERVRDTFRVPLKPYPSFRWLIVSRFGIMMGIYTVSGYLLYYIRDTLGFGENESLGVLKNFLVLSTLTGLLGTFPSGILAGKYGRKRVLYGANIICMVAGLCFALASNLTLAYVAAAIFGIGFGAFSAVDWALATSLLPPREPAKYMGVWGVSDTLAQVIAPLAAGPIAIGLSHLFSKDIGYRGLMLLALCWFLVGTLALRPIEEHKK